MTDLATVLARMLDEMEYLGHGGFTIKMADTPIGTALSALVEAALAVRVAWDMKDGGDDFWNNCDALVESQRRLPRGHEVTDIGDDILDQVKERHAYPHTHEGHVYDGYEPCDALSAYAWARHRTAERDAARADANALAEALRTMYGIHQKALTPHDRCRDKADRALAAHDANNPPETTANIPLKETR